MARIVFLYSECESLGIEYLSAALRDRGHSTHLVLDPRLFDTELTPNRFFAKLFSYQEIVVEKALKLNPDLVCLSVFSDNYNWAAKITEKIKKKKNIPIVWGGIHPTIVPEVIIKNEYVDYVCVGEGEGAIVELVEAIENKKETRYIANIWSKQSNRVFDNSPRELQDDLNRIMFPDKELFFNEYPGLIKGYKIITARGCPYQCTYCAHHYQQQLYKGKGKLLRRRSVQNVIEELEIAKSKYGIRIVRFFDDVFTLDIKWLKEFAEEYKKKINLPYFCFIHPNAINEEIVGLLEESNCKTVFMGFGTYTQMVRSKCLKRDYTNKRVVDAMKMLKKSSIFLIMDCILGIPGQGAKEALRIARFFNEYRPEALSVLFLRYYPKTEITDLARLLGVLDKERINDIEKCSFSERIIIPRQTYRILKKIQFLMLLMQFLPNKAGRILLKHKWYKFMPAKDLNNLSVIATSVLPRFDGKRRIHTDVVSVGQYIAFHIWFMIKKLYEQLKYFLKPSFSGIEKKSKINFLSMR